MYEHTIRVVVEEVADQAPDLQMETVARAPVTDASVHEVQVHTFSRAVKQQALEVQ